MPHEERLELLCNIVETLKSDLRFNLNQKRWNTVSEIKRNLKIAADRIAGLEYKMRMENRAAKAA